MPSSPGCSGGSPDEWSRCGYLGCRAAPAQRGEREILDFLLAPELPGVPELREQARTARARTWGCGCGSFDIVVDRDNTSPTWLRSRPAIDADAKQGVAPERLVCLMLWVDEDGWLDSLEVVDVADEHGEFNPIPPPSMYDAPRVRLESPQSSRGLRAVVARLLGRKP